MRLLILLLALVALGATAVTAGAAGKRDTLTVTTSLGPLEEGTEDGAEGEAESEAEEEDEIRELRAKGRAPKGSRLVVRFYRGSKKLATTRPKVRSGRRYSAEHEITRTGAYKVKVTATTPADERITVSARLRYTPKAKAPSAPDDTED